RGLAVIHVTYSPYVYVRLRSVELGLRHICSSLNITEQKTSPSKPSSIANFLTHVGPENTDHFPAERRNQRV
ncbi:hypothetical protein KAX06_09075, partial [candidate division WOR-3 bacterium]|nr:hypothetical protein [candidate division WOR-3 bacterium]